MKSIWVDKNCAKYGLAVSIFSGVIEMMDIKQD